LFVGASVTAGREASEPTRNEMKSVTKKYQNNISLLSSEVTNH